MKETIELKISKDGDQYCVLYGTNLQEGHAEFNEYLSIAMNRMSTYLLKNNIIE